MNTTNNVATTAKGYKFTPLNPPLLKDYGFGYMVDTYNHTAPSAQRITISKTLKIPVDKLFPELGILTTLIDCELESTQYWLQQSIPIRTSEQETITVTKIRSSSVTQLDKLSDSLSAEVGVSFGGFSAKISGEISHSKSTEETIMSTQKYTKQVTIDKDTEYVDWVLINNVILKIKNPKQAYADVIAAIKSIIKNIPALGISSDLGIAVIANQLLTPTVSNVSLVIAHYNDSLFNG